MTEIVDDKRWTTECLVDELFLYLANFKEIIENNQGLTLEVKKYSQQANELITRIPIAKPAPTFIIYVSDLTPKLIQELKHSSNEERRYVVMHAVGRIFENINSRLYHLSIAKKLKVQFK